MATKSLKIESIQIKRATADVWSAVNPVLGDGELGYDKTNKVTKIGDGSTAWNDLPSSNGSVETANITLTTTGWSGSSGQWSQTVAVSGISATSINYITIKQGATTAEKKAFIEAELQDGGQAKNSITLISASETKPSENIYCRVIILKIGV